MILAVVPASAQERIGAFTFVRNVDGLTDVDRSRIATVELAPTLLRTASLIWRCDGGRLELGVFADEFLHSGSPVPVQWRFDQRPAANLTHWGVSTTGVAAFAPDLDLALFTADARSANEVLLRVTDFRGVNYDLRFNVAGLTRALERLPCRTYLDALEARDAEVRAPAAAEAARAKTGEGTNVRLESVRRNYPTYYDNIIRQIQRCFLWQGGGSWGATIYFAIRRDGTAADIEFVTRSGNAAFDLEAIGAIDCAGQGGFGALPEDLPYRNLSTPMRQMAVRY